MTKNKKAHPLLPLAKQSLLHWPIETQSIALVSISENIVFKVTARDKKCYALRIHRPGYHTLEELQSEHIVLQVLHEADINVPLPVQTLQGDGYAIIPMPDSHEIRHISIYHWIEGQLLSDLFKDKEYQKDTIAYWYTRMGTLIAKMHNVAEHFQPPPGFSRHTLDAQGTMGEKPFWGRFWDHPKLRTDEARYLNALRKRIFSILKVMPKDTTTFGMIHSDLHSNNLLVNDNKLYAIDFDDAAFGWYQFDFAVALPQHTDDEFDVAQHAMYSAYQKQRPVSPHFFDTVMLFKLVRGMNSIGWLLDRPEHLSETILRRWVELVKKLEEVVF